MLNVSTSNWTFSGQQITWAFSLLTSSPTVTLQRSGDLGITPNTSISRSLREGIISF